MTKILGFNMPGDELSELPRSVEPTAEDLRAMKTYLETRGIPRAYLESTTGSTHEGVAILPRFEKLEKTPDKT